MRNKAFILIATAICLSLVAGCATTIKPIPAQDLNQKLQSGAIVQQINNFEVILDTSASMYDPHKWSHYGYTDKLTTTKLEYAQSLARLFNDSIPDMKLTAGLRDFTGKRLLRRDYTNLWYGMAPYEKEDLGKAIYAVNISGVDSPLDLAIDAATMDLKLLAGKSAVIIFSDGVVMPKAVASAQAMKAAMKENICIYTVQIGNDPEGKALLQKVVKAGDCGAYVTGEEVSSAAGMAAFVEKVFIGTPPPPAKAPPAEAPPAVLPPVVVPPPEVPKKLEAIYFDFDKYVVRPEYRDTLKRNAEWLQANKDYDIRIEGNCDERGTSEYNMALGQRRADAAAKHLLDLGIGKDRIRAVSYGEAKPACTEHSAACWIQNRRADFVVLKR
jgi:OOP family OmpA-OmpF porin